MNQEKQKFDEIMTLLRYDKGMKVKEIANRSGIDHTRLTNIVNNRTKPNKYDLQKIQSLHETLHSPSQPTPNLSTTDISKDIKDIKEMVQGIVKAKYDVVEPAIKEVARKYNTSQAKVIEALEVILGREIEEQRKKKE